MAFETKIPDSRACMPSFCESDYVVHPASLDAVMQAMMIGIPRMDGIQKQVWVPTGVQSIRVSRDITKAYAAYLHGICESSRTGAREMTGSFIVGDGKFDSMPGLVMDGFQFKGLGGSQSSTDTQNKALSKLYSSPSWKPDLSLLDAQTLRELAGSHCGSQDLVQFCHTANGIVNEMCQTTLAMAKLGSTSPPHLHKYVEWMRTRSDLGGPSPPISPDRAEFNIVKENACGIHGLDDFIEKYPVDGGLLRHTFRSLPAMFSGESVPIATLMADENFSKFYKEAQGLHLNNQITRKWFELKAHKKPDLRIIEIGAGTASTSLPVLQQLSGDSSETPQFSNYTFTDISSGWFESARQVLSDYKSRMDYRVLDISVDPTQQGFEAESYDVVLAINVRSGG